MIWFFGEHIMIASYFDCSWYLVLLILNY